MDSNQGSHNSNAHSNYFKLKNEFRSFYRIAKLKEHLNVFANMDSKQDDSATINPSNYNAEGVDYSFLDKYSSTSDVHSTPESTVKEKERVIGKIKEINARRKPDVVFEWFDPDDIPDQYIGVNENQPKDDEERFRRMKERLTSPWISSTTQIRDDAVWTKQEVKAAANPM